MRHSQFNVRFEFIIVAHHILLKLNDYHFSNPNYIKDFKRMHPECGHNDDIFFKRFILKNSTTINMDNVVFEESVSTDACNVT